MRHPIPAPTPQDHNPRPGGPVLPRTLAKLTAAIAVATLTISAAAYLFGQGLLTPPGPPAPIMKTLDQVEPRIPLNSTNTPGGGGVRYRITEQGSYYLTGNVRVVSAINGIEIAASNVTLDLMGYTLDGDPTRNAQSAIHVTVGMTNICIKNGAISNWRQDGVDGFTAANSRLSDLRVSGCGETGLQLGLGGTIERCSARDNHIGIFASVVTDCIAYNNSSDGIRGMTISNCRAVGNSGDGIVVRNTSPTITNCSASGNTGDGIVSTVDGGMIRNCTTHNNTGGGIVVANGCQVVGNACNDNDGAGILVTGTNCVIRDNMVNLNTNGIKVNGIRNLIIGNTARSCPPFNYDIVSGNRVGPVVQPDVSGPIQSNASQPTGFSNTDPWANINY